MANVTYTFDFEKYHLFRVTVATTLKVVADKGINMAKSRKGAHNRGGTNTVLVMNAGQEQQLHAHILVKKLWGDGISVPVYGYVVVGKAEERDNSRANVYLGGTVEVNIKKESGQNPTYTLSHCGKVSDDSYVGSTTHFKWETGLGTTLVEA
jgi:hypothetical protein